MELQPRFNIYLDYKGYQIEEKSYRTAPSPLMGTKFTSGRSAYSDLDFWQMGAMTDFTKGINQKYLVDPSMSFYSIGLDLRQPGECKLERDTQTFSGLPVGAGKITAHFRRLNDLYLGDDVGHIYKTSNGSTFTLVYTVTDTYKKIYNFYEMSGRLFATTGPGYTYVNVSPDTGNVWNNEAISTQFPLPAYDQTPTFGSSIYGVNKQAAMVFQVPMGGDTFETLRVKVKKTGSPTANMVFVIYEPSVTTTNTPGAEVPGATFNIPAASITTSYTWIDIDVSQFQLKAGIKYWLIPLGTSADSSNYFQWGYEEGYRSTYDSGNGETFDSTVPVIDQKWTNLQYRSYYFELKRRTILNLYFVMVESDYAFGWFDDGIRRSIDGYNWTPEPPDPLWVMPSGEGIPLNAVSIPKSFVSGSHRGLWAFVGGSSGLNLWNFPDYTNANNFRGMEKWGRLAIFSIEDQGLYYTDGSQVVPTTMTYLAEGFKFKSCKHIHASGWDVYALVSDNGTDWYLARSNMNYNAEPKYWWIVKRLDKEPAHIAGWNEQRVYIFYEDGTAEYFNKTSGPYVQEGHLVTSWIDENMVKILKMYYNLSIITSQFPGDGNAAISCYARIGYLKDRQTDYIYSDTTYGQPNTSEVIFQLPNPTLGNRIMIKYLIGRPAAINTVTPVITDLIWKYILQKPKEDVLAKKNFTCTILAEDLIEDYTLDVQRPGQQKEQFRIDIINDLYATSAKKEVLNFIGADNVSEIGLLVDSSQTDAYSYLTIDRTNYTISVTLESTSTEFTANANIGGGVRDYIYKDKTLQQVTADLNILFPGLIFTIHQDQDPLRSANDLEPILEQTISRDENTFIMVGTDIHAVIMGTNSPSQSKLLLDGRGSDRLQLALREA